MEPLLMILAPLCALVAFILLLCGLTNALVIGYALSGWFAFLALLFFWMYEKLTGMD